MGIQEFLAKFKGDNEFASKFIQFTSFDSLLKAVNDAGYSLTKDDVLEYIHKNYSGEINDKDLEKLAGNENIFNASATLCSDACSVAHCPKD